MSQAPASEIAESPLMYELVVVGAGPAGLSAALFAVGQRIKTVVVSAEVGGQALHSTHVENYMGFEHIGGAMLVERFEQQLRDYFIEHVSDDVSLIRRPADYFDIDLKGQGSLQSRSVIVASGMVPNTLGAPGEVEFTGRGVSYYADNYGPTAHDKNVLVVGGGNSALQAVLEVSPIARKVMAITRSGWTGEPGKIDAVSKFENVEMLPPCNVQRIEGDEHVESVVVSPSDGGEPYSLDVDLVFVQIGFHPSTEYVSDMAKLNDRREIIVGRDNGTNVTGLFAVGDCTEGVGKEIAVAVGDGARAALSAKSFIRSKAWLEAG